MEELLDIDTTPENLSEFEWKRGDDRVTTGIHMSSAIFKHDFDDGRKIAIILLDTQGMFDTQANIKDCTTIFALSSLLSSVQMFNVMQKIQEINLQHLQLFAGFGRFAGQNNVSKPFQRLMFLVRDWCLLEKLDGGREYIEKVMAVQPDQKQENQELREQLKFCCEEIDCFLMPHPGLFVTTNANFQGQLDDIDQLFLEQAEKLVLALMKPENLKIKRINGQPVTASEFVDLFKKYFRTLNGKDTPNIRSIHEVNSEHFNLKIFRKSQHHYADKLVEADLASLFLTPQNTELMTMHRAMKEKAMSFYDHEALHGSNSAIRLKEKLDAFLEFSLEGFLLLHQIIMCLRIAASAIQTSDIARTAFSQMPDLANYEYRELIMRAAPILIRAVVTPVLKTIIQYTLLNVFPLFMKKYERMRFPPALSNRDELTQRFWEHHFGQSKNEENLSDQIDWCAVKIYVHVACTPVVWNFVKKTAQIVKQSFVKREKLCQLF